MTYLPTIRKKSYSFSSIVFYFIVRLDLGSRTHSSSYLPSPTHGLWKLLKIIYSTEWIIKVSLEFQKEKRTKKKKTPFIQKNGYVCPSIFNWTSFNESVINHLHPMFVRQTEFKIERRWQCNEVSETNYILVLIYSRR